MDPTNPQKGKRNVHVEMETGCYMTVCVLISNVRNVSSEQVEVP